LAEEYQDAIQQKWEPGYAALKVVEKHLTDHCFLVGDRYTIADISLFAYISLAPEGGFDLTGFPVTQTWLERLIAQPGHIRITQTCP